MFTLARVHPCEFIEILNFTADVYWKKRWVEAGDSFDARVACENCAAEGVLTNAIGADHAHAGDYRSFHCGSEFTERGLSELSKAGDKAPGPLEYRMR